MDTGDRVMRADFKKAVTQYHLNIVDDSMFPKMMLVETSEDLEDVASDDFSEKWSIFPETTYSVPDTRQRLSKKKG